MTRTNPQSMQQVYLISEAFLSGSKQVRTPAGAIRIPIKGGMTIPNIATFDHGTYGEADYPPFFLKGDG